MSLILMLNNHSDQRRRRIWRFRRGPGEFVISVCLAPYPLIQRKFSPDFYVLHGPHWAAQGGLNPWTPGQLRRWFWCYFYAIKLFGRVYIPDIPPCRYAHGSHLSLERKTGQHRKVRLKATEEQSYIYRDNTSREFCWYISSDFLRLDCSILFY